MIQAVATIGSDLPAHQPAMPMSSPRYRAWLVDMDGTLYRARWLRPAMAIEVALRGPFAIRAIRTFRQEHERLRQELGEPVANPYEEQLLRAARRLGVSVTDLRALLHQWMICRPGKWVRLFRRVSLLDQIQQFRSLGGVTAVVSDYPASEKLASLKAANLFDTVVANGEPGGPGRLKPWPDGYLLAAERLRVPARECLVIGDRQDADGEAARRAGMDFRLIR